jgi:hypothetical protein
LIEYEKRGRSYCIKEEAGVLEVTNPNGNVIVRRVENGGGQVIIAAGESIFVMMYNDNKELLSCMGGACGEV